MNKRTDAGTGEGKNEQTSEETNEREKDLIIKAKKTAFSKSKRQES